MPAYYAASRCCARVMPSRYCRRAWRRDPSLTPVATLSHTTCDAPPHDTMRCAGAVGDASNLSDALTSSTLDIATRDISRMRKLPCGRGQTLKRAMAGLLPPYYSPRLPTLRHTTYSTSPYWRLHFGISFSLGALPAPCRFHHLTLLPQYRPPRVPPPLFCLPCLTNTKHAHSRVRWFASRRIACHLQSL